MYDGDSIHEEAELRREEVESAEPLQPKKSGMFDDATEEIANIDERLQALQNFLKAAKEKGGSGAGRSFR